MEVKYYVCNHCGSIIEMVKDKGVPVADFCLCDGEQVEEVYAGPPDRDSRIWGYRFDHGKKNDVGRSQGKSCGGDSSKVRRSSEEYRPMSGGLWDSIEIKSYGSGYFWKRAYRGCYPCSSR